MDEMGGSFRDAALRRRRRDDVRQRMSKETWERVLSRLPGQVGTRARNSDGSRRYIEGVLWIAETRARWKDLPAEYGRWRAVYVKFTRWAREGLWEVIIPMLDEEPLQGAMTELVDRYWAAHQARKSS